MGKDCLLLVKLVRGNYYKGGHGCFLEKKKAKVCTGAKGSTRAYLRFHVA